MMFLVFIFALGAIVNGQDIGCIEKSGVDEDLVEMIEQFFEFDVDDEKLKEYVFCTWQNNGAITEDGIFKKDAYMAQIYANDRINQSQIVTACSEEVKPDSNVIEYTWNLHKCINEKEIEQDELRMGFKQCLKESNPDRKLLKRLEIEDMNYDDESIKTFLYCMMKKYRFISEDGSVFKEMYLLDFPTEMKKDVEKAMDDCITEKFTDADKFWTFQKCFIAVKNVLSQKYNQEDDQFPLPVPGEKNQQEDQVPLPAPEGIKIPSKEL